MGSWLELHAWLFRAIRIMFSNGGIVEKTFFSEGGYQAYLVRAAGFDAVRYRLLATVGGSGRHAHGVPPLFVLTTNRMTRGGKRVMVLLLS